MHTYTKPKTSSTRSRGLGWRIHGSVEDTKLSTNKQHSLSLSIPKDPRAASDIMCITLGNPGWLDPMSAGSHIGPGETRLMYGHLPSFVRGRFLPSCYNCTKTLRIEQLDPVIRSARFSCNYSTMVKTAISQMSFHDCGFDSGHGFDSQPGSSLL